VTVPVLSNVSGRNVNGLFFLKRGSYVIVRNASSRVYIGEILDLYKLSSGNRYGSVKTANAVEELRYLSFKVYLPLVGVRNFCNFFLDLMILIYLTSRTIRTSQMMPTTAKTSNRPFSRVVTWAAR
jgi:hypothetical protein